MPTEAPPAPETPEPGPINKWYNGLFSDDFSRPVTDKPSPNHLADVAAPHVQRSQLSPAGHSASTSTPLTADIEPPQQVEYEVDKDQAGRQLLASAFEAWRHWAVSRHTARIHQGKGQQQAHGALLCGWHCAL